MAAGHGTPRNNQVDTLLGSGGLTGLVDASSGGTLSGGTSSSTLYGLSKDAQDSLFSLDGLPGLGSGQVKGSDLISAFLAAGASGDSQRAQIVAAIQHALLYGKYYGSKDYVPTFGVAQKQDAEALASALTDLYNAQKAPTNGPSGRPMNLSQWLSGHAAVGAVNGISAGAAAPQVVNLRAPNPDDIASEYQKVARQVLGRKPSAAETNAFVNTYTQQYMATEHANNQAQYDAMVQKAQVKIGLNHGAYPTLPATPAVPYNPATDLAGNLNPNVSQQPTGAGSGNMNPAVQNGGPDPYGSPQQHAPTPDDLTQSMQTLQDVINANAGASATNQPGFIEAGTNAPETTAVAAENFARNTHPNEAAANDLGNTMNMFFQLLSGVGQ